MKQNLLSMIKEKAPKPQGLDAVLANLNTSLTETASELSETASQLAVVTQERNQLAAEVERLRRDTDPMRVEVGQLREKLQAAEKALSQAHAAISLEQTTLAGKVLEFEESQRQAEGKITTLTDALGKECQTTARLTGQVEALKQAPKPVAPVTTPTTIPDFEVKNIVRGHDGRTISLDIKPKKVN